MDISRANSRPRRNRQTRKSVLVVERIARTAITAGGIGTIMAVALIFVFLVWVVLPLFSSPELLDERSFETQSVARAPFQMGVDDDRMLAWTLHRDGVLELQELATGRQVGLSRPFAEQVPTSASFSVGSVDCAFGFADGSLRIGRIAFESRFLDGQEKPAQADALRAGESCIYEGGVLQRTTIGQLRHVTVELELEEPLDSGIASPILMIDHAVTPSGLSLLTLQEDGALRMSRVRSKTNLMTGKVSKSLKHVELSPPQDGHIPDLPVGLLVGGLGQHVYVIHRGGETEHWDLRNFSAPVLFEQLDLVETPGVEVTAVRFVAGRKTILVGTSAGEVETWFPAQEQGSDTDPLLIQAESLLVGDSPVRSLAPSPRSRLVAVGFESGRIALVQATLRTLLLSFQCEELPTMLLVPPKEDALIARSESRLTSWAIDTKYPEANMAALFRPVWYEGYKVPMHFWQSSSASDDFEPKLGLMPLVFGTLKATIYSMIFGAPLAILAAIYTSEFMAKSMRSSVKSTVELMASLPSVVLGFIAALVIAPFVQSIVPAIMAGFLVIPATTLLGAHLWMLLPNHLAVRWAGWQRFAAITLTLPLGVLLALQVGPWFEGACFSGDITAWLDGQIGEAWGGWFFLLLPVAALITILAGTLIVGPLVRARSQAWSRGRVARAETLKYVLGLLASLAIAALLALVLQSFGFDPRGEVVGTYVQRNALIVGFVMGFAIVPIIYTLSEDALSEVPGALREGSLGAGATQWQTTVRIVLPFAMSGIFSAMMIGLGRAVGETMIVLMAAGNTPIMEWNIFNGFRTLSANIAVELPEAVVGSGHYRTLFLAALVLFAITFVLNTFAEVVRRHFRRRFKAL